MAGATATLMLGGWPEPFGLVAIESMATGTPVIARRAGAYTETIEHGQTGFLVDDVDEAVLAVSLVGALDRAFVAGHTRTVFSADRMVDQYVEAYEVVRATRRPTPSPIVEVVSADQFRNRRVARAAKAPGAAATVSAVAER